MIKKLLVISILFLLAVVPVQAQCPDNFCLWLPVVQKFNPCQEAGMSDWKIVVPESTTNEALNPSAETTGNFTNAGGSTVTRSTTYQHYGLYSYRVQTAGDNEGVEFTLDTLANAIHYVTVRVAGTLPTSWDWSLDNATYTAPTLLESIDGTWSLYGLQFPAAQANGSTTLYIDQNGAGSGDFYLDGIQVEQKEYWTTYCDGTQQGCEWNGAEHAATSQRSASSRAGGREQDLEDNYYLNVGGMAGTGDAPHDLSVDSYAALPGGELNSIKVDSRVITLTGFIYGTSWSNFHSNKQTLLNVLSPDAYPDDENGPQPVRLRYQGATVHKEIAVHYESGLGGELSSTGACFWENVAVRFEAPDPYWYEIGESAELLDTNDSATFRIAAARLRSTGQWDALGPPNAAGTYNRVYAIAEDDTYIYLGGNFLNFDNIAAADYIVRYEKSSGTFSALDVGLNGLVQALVLDASGDLYIGGNFTNAGGVAAADYLTRWDGTNFNAVGTPNTGAAAITAVVALEFDNDGNLYIGGQFQNWADVAAADYVAMWDGASHTALGTGANNSVVAITVRRTDNRVFLGGAFTNFDGSGAQRIAQWDGTDGAVVGTAAGMDNVCWALASTVDGLVYAGGAFDTAGGVTVNRIAVWDGQTFYSLAGGMDADVDKISIAPDGTIWVIGDFTTAGSIDAPSHLARWNGYAWVHYDFTYPFTADGAVFASQYTDPVIKENYDIWLGFDNTGTGYYGGLVAVTNDGSAKAFPKIVFTRSGGTTATIQTVRNERTSDELFFDYDLLDGETLTIDLSSTQKSISSSLFGSRQDAILPNSDFGNWHLLNGDNNVTAFVSVTGGPTITAYFLWKDAYKSQD